MVSFVGILVVAAEWDAQLTSLIPLVVVVVVEVVVVVVVVVVFKFYRKT